MYLFLLAVVFPVFFPQFAYSLDNIITAYDRFAYDIEQFIPIVTQEVEFAELSGLTDDQAYEQIKSFFPTLQLRIQELRNIGIHANDRRRKYKESLDKMCGRGHDFGYLKVNHRLRDILAMLHSQKVTVQRNLAMLTAMKKALEEWKTESNLPCTRKSG